MPPEDFKRVRANTSPTMSSSGTSSAEGSSSSPTPPAPKDYYNAGSAETVTETKLTVSRLETVRHPCLDGVLGTNGQTERGLSRSLFSC